jgi:hypothetical protein
MQQSNVIFAALFVAFIVYVTLRGELPTYVGLLKGTSGNMTVASSQNQNLTATNNPVAANAASLETQAEGFVAGVPGIAIPAPAPPLQFEGFQ